VTTTVASWFEIIDRPTRTAYDMKKRRLSILLVEQTMSLVSLYVACWPWPWLFEFKYKPKKLHALPKKAAKHESLPASVKGYRQIEGFFCQVPKAVWFSKGSK